MPLNPHSILIFGLAGLACVAVAPTTATAQTAPPRTTGSGSKPGGFVTAPTASAVQPKPSPRKRAKRPLREPVGPQLLSLAIGPEDYPAPLLRISAEGRVVARIRISASGAPAGCEIVESSGYPDLDAHSCNLILQRARFEPARDEYGDAVASTARAPISWRIPE